MSRSKDEYESRLDQHSSESRIDPLRDAAHEVMLAWMHEDELEKQDLSERFWNAISNLGGVLLRQKRGEPQEVPEVEVTYDRSPVPAEGPERPLEARRSGAKNLSDPIYQNAFISEARASMGQPSISHAQALLGKYVKLTFNVDWHPAKGILTDVVDDQAPFLMLDNYHERHYPLYAIQAIEEIPHHPSSGSA